MYKIGWQIVGQNINSTYQEYSISNSDRFKWNVKIFHKSGGLKKDWFIGQDDCPISKLSFELNEKICGAGTLSFAFLDFPLDSDDYIEVSYLSDLKYKALIDVSIDPKGGKTKLVPYSKRLQELLINYAYSSKTIAYMLGDIINNISDSTDIFYNSAYIDTGSTSTYTFDYSGYETPKKIINELVGSLEDRSWGVNANNIFTVYQPETTITQTLFYGFDPAYASLDNTKDYTKIKATRYQVFKKSSDSGEVERIGQVGYDAESGDYPVLEIENFIRKREIKYTASEEITSDSEALEIAYSNLKTNTITPETTKIKELRVDKYFPSIGDLLKVQDKIEYIQKIILNCESLTLDSNVFQNDGAWSNVTLDTSAFVTGEKSIYFDNSSLIFKEYQFSTPINFFHPIKIGFMVYSNRSNQDLQFSYGVKNGYSYGNYSEGNYSESSGDYFSSANTETVYIPNSNQWFYKEYTLNATTLKYIGFTFIGDNTNDLEINIDRVQMFIPHKPIYEQNVVKANFEITKEGTKCNVELNQYELQATETTQTLVESVNKLNTITQA